MNNVDNYKKSIWEMGNCTDKNVIYLNIKGMGDTRFSHLHITKSDIEMLIKDLQMLLDNNIDNVNYTIKRT